MSQRFEGKNLEEALTHAAETFGVERWQLTYHVLLEKRGFLGGVKRVVIEADVNQDAPPPPPPSPAPAMESRGPRPPRERERGGGGRGGRRDRNGNRAPREDRGGGRRPRRSRESDLEPGDFEKFMGEIPEQGPESDAARMVREWCETTLSLSRLDVAARTEENDEQIIVRLYGSDGRRLIDRHGELLDAIQVLANKALVGRKVEKEIELDCEEFKGRRTEELRQRAQEVADRVRRGGREELLPAMTPIERRIIHLALRDDEEVTTESRGEGFYKRVAIIPRDASPSADEVPPAPEP